MKPYGGKGYEQAVILRVTERNGDVSRMRSRS